MKSSSQSFDDQFSARAQLGILPSVAIAGCDLMGSCLYTSGVCASNSGKVNIRLTSLYPSNIFLPRSFSACSIRSFDCRHHVVLLQRCLL